MATYVSNKLRAFKTPGDPCDLPLNSKSLFHLKTYRSATDPRAWAYGSHDRKQYILELFAAASPQTSDLYIGKYITVHSLLRTLMSNKDADIAFLRNQMNVLEAFIDNLDLTEERRNTFECLKRQCINNRANPKILMPATNSFHDINYLSKYITADESQNEIISELNLKIRGLQDELDQQTSVAKDAICQLSILSLMFEEKERLEDENLKLQKTVDVLSNTKGSSNNDLLCKARINDLQQEIRRHEAMKRLNLKMVRNDLVAIPSLPLVTHDVAIEANDRCVDIKQVIEERNTLQETVRKLLKQMEKFSKFDQMIERKFPDRHDKCPGDHASQIVQTVPFLHVELELRKEVEQLKEKLSHFEIKNLEFDRLRLRISELQVANKENEDLKVKFNVKYMEQRAVITQHMNQIDYLNSQCTCFKAELERYKKYEDENNILTERCKNLQNLVDSQQGRLRFLENCKSLVVESGSKITVLQEELDKKSTIIKVSEEKLIALQTQLRDSINQLNSETTDLKGALQKANKRIAGLLENETEQHTTIHQLQEDLRTKNDLLKSWALERQRDENYSKLVPKVIQERDNIIEQLRKKLVDLQRDNEKLSEMGSRLNSILLDHSFSKSNTIISNGEKNTGKFIEHVFEGIRELQGDLANTTSSCEVSNIYKLESRFKELQSLAKGQVHWLACGLRKCKEQIHSLQCQSK